MCNNRIRIGIDLCKVISPRDLHCAIVGRGQFPQAHNTCSLSSDIDSLCLGILNPPVEPLEKFIVDLKILASTCNFGTLWDLLVRDRIICGIRNSKLREDLLKVADLDLDKCINACRASKLLKERNSNRGGVRISASFKQWKQEIRVPKMTKMGT